MIKAKEASFPTALSRCRHVQPEPHGELLHEAQLRLWAQVRALARLQRAAAPRDAGRPEDELLPLLPAVPQDARRVRPHVLQVLPPGGLRSALPLWPRY
jgi:hypothetical protein